MGRRFRFVAVGAPNRNKRVYASTLAEAMQAAHDGTIKLTSADNTDNVLFEGKLNFHVIRRTSMVHLAARKQLHNRR